MGRSVKVMGASYGLSETKIGSGARNVRKSTHVFIFMNTLEYKPLCTIHEYEYISGCVVFMILNM